MNLLTCLHKSSCDKYILPSESILRCFIRNYLLFYSHNFYLCDDLCSFVLSFIFIFFLIDKTFISYTKYTGMSWMNKRNAMVTIWGEHFLIFSFFYVYNAPLGNPQSSSKISINRRVIIEIQVTILCYVNKAQAMFCLYFECWTKSAILTNFNW